MSLPTEHLYEFGPFRLEPAERRLLRDGEEVPLPQKAFDVLVVLVSRAGHLVPKEDLAQSSLARHVRRGGEPVVHRILASEGAPGRVGQRALHRHCSEAWVSIHSRRPDAGDGRLHAGQNTAIGRGPSTPHESPDNSAISRMSRSRDTGSEDRGNGRRDRDRCGAAGLRGVVLIRQTREIAPPQTRADLTMTVPEHITLTTFDQPVISPDGRRVAFTGLSEGTRHLWIRPLDSSMPILLPGTDGAMLPFWSPDSRSLAFFADRKVKRIDAGGGPVTTVCDARFPLNQGSRGAWGRDGVILFGDNAKGPVYRVADTGGVPEPVTRLDSSRHEAAAPTAGLSVR